MKDEIIDYLQAERQKTSQAIEHFAEEFAHTQLHGELFRTIWERLIHYALTEGKWARPTLARMAYEQMTGKSAEAIVLASGVLELTHRLILIHDDIADRDMQRHGEPTMEAFFNQWHQSRYHVPAPEYYGAANAVVAGDILNAFLNQVLVDSKLSPESTVSVLHGLNQLWLDTVEGWMIETDQKKQPIAEVDLNAIGTAQELVSARYSFVWPLRIGQLLAGKAFGDWNQALEDYGYRVGMAFQIRDDIMAIFGDQKTTGKPVGNDLREGKKTVLLYHTYRLTDEENRNWLQSVMGREISPEELERYRHLAESSGALAQTQAQAQDYVLQATQALAALGTQTPAVRRWHQLAEYMIVREV